CGTFDFDYQSRPRNGYQLRCSSRVLAERKTHRSIDRFETAGRCKECFRRTHKEITGRREEAAQYLHDPLLSVAVKVNQDVSAEDDVIRSAARTKAGR